MAAHRRRTGKKVLGYAARGGSHYGDYLGSSPARRSHKKDTKERGPTGPQQKLLAQLCRDFGLKYPSPSTSSQASRLIEELLGRKRARSRGDVPRAA